MTPSSDGTRFPAVPSPRPDKPWRLSPARIFVILVGVIVVVANEMVPTSSPWATALGALTSIIGLLTGTPLISVRVPVVVLPYPVMRHRR
ncbi:hypothetical protein [Streptomyces xanthophaeus]|uniref:hypothetical protein n=1 Tax=Streptomyces xanthophaeus TaxID=67385 RepID=UPI003711CD39